MDSTNYAVENSSQQENENLNLLILVSDKEPKGPLPVLGNNYRRSDCKNLKLENANETLLPKIDLDVLSKECARNINSGNSSLEYYGAKKNLN